MVKHIICWKLKETSSEEEKQKILAGIKAGLEGLDGKIPGLLSIHVVTEGLLSSSADCMLDSTFADEAALKRYSVHPLHQAAANTFVRPFTQIRLSMDYKV